jgi:hypothetical protein
MKEYEPMVYKRIVQLSEVIVQRTHVDLAELFGYFTCALSLIVHSKPSLIPSQSVLTLWQTWRKYLWVPFSEITRR